MVWDAVYDMAEPELKEAMDLGYPTGQRPADVILMRSDDREGDYFMVIQGKTKQKLRILLTAESVENSLGRLSREITERNAHHPSKYLLISKHGKRMTKGMLRLRWDKAREKAQQKAIKDGDPMLAAKIGGFQFRDIRPKAVEIGKVSELVPLKFRNPSKNDRNQPIEDQTIETKKPRICEAFSMYLAGN